MTPSLPAGSPGLSGKAGPTAFSVHGAGQPVVLVHGVGMAREVWAPQVSALAHDHQVITYDLLGHGASDLPPEDLSLADCADQLDALLDHLDVAEAGIVGHSLGALVALEFALRHAPRTQRVAALNAVFERSPEQRAAVEARAAALLQAGPATTVEPTLERWFGKPVPAHLNAAAELTGRLLRGVNPLGYARAYGLFARADRAHSERLPTLARPALFMTGAQDQNSTPAMTQAMAGLVPGATCAVLPEARHMMNLTHPEAVNQALRGFLAGAGR